MSECSDIVYLERVARVFAGAKAGERILAARKFVQAYLDEMAKREARQ